LKNAVELTVNTFGGIDILINNTSAISISNTPETDTKRHDLMHQINTRGTFMCSKYCIPHLKRASNPHILNHSPLLDIVNHKRNWFGDHTAYTIAKYGMTLCAHGMSEELRDDKIGVNTLWPRTTISTAAVQNLLGGSSMMNASLTPEVMADVAYVILTSKSSTTTGNYFLDDEVLASVGITDLKKYQADPNLKPEELQPDFFC